MQLVPFFIFSFFISFIISSSHLFFGLPSGRVNIGFHLYTLFTILPSGIRCKWPNQLNLWAFMWFIVFLCLTILFNSSFVLIFHVPSLYFVGPKIILNTFLLNTINFIYGFFQTPCFTGVCYYWSYNTAVQFQFWFLKDHSAFKKILVIVICFISKCYLFTLVVLHMFVHLY
jgi:hypothetical protein